MAHTLAVEGAAQSTDPWSARDGWRLFGSATRRFDLEAGGAHHEVLLSRHHRGGMTLTVEGESIEFAVQSTDAETHELFLGIERIRVKTYAQGERVAVFTADGSAVLTEVDLIAHAGDGPTEGGRLTAPMPGKLVAFLAKAGDTVTKGQPLAVMEAMKMEHTISAPRDGKVAELLFAVGDQVGDGAELLKLEA